jgi:hypothetical protein
MSARLLSTGVDSTVTVQCHDLGQLRQNHPLKTVDFSRRSPRLAPAVTRSRSVCGLSFNLGRFGGEYALTYPVTSLHEMRTTRGRSCYKRKRQAFGGRLPSRFLRR